jgi:hypothetical protein
MATESENKTSAERFLARAKELAWLGAAAAALVTAIWGATTYLNDKRPEYVKTFNEKQITLSFETAETVAKLDGRLGHARREAPRPLLGTTGLG